MKTLDLATLTNQQLVTMSSVDVRANLRSLIDYSDSLLTRSAVIYAIIKTTAEGMSEKPVPFLITAFPEWPKSDTADKDGNFPALGFSTVELKIREKKLVLTEEQKSAFDKVNAFKIWLHRQKEGASVPPAKTLPKKLLEAITKLRALIDHASTVEIEKEDTDGNVTLEEIQVIPVADLSALIETISQI